MSSYQYQKAVTNNNDLPGNKEVLNDSSKNQPNSKLVAAFFVVLFSGPAAILFQRSNTSNTETDAATLPLLGSPNIARNCYDDAFGKVYDEQAIVDSTASSGQDQFTTIILPGEDGKRAPYYIASTHSPVAIFGNVEEYLEVGTVTTVTDGEATKATTATYGPGTNCHFDFEGESGLDGVWAPPESFVYPCNSWDGGKSWIGTGVQDFGDGVKTAQAFVLVALEGEVCKERARDVYDKLVERGVDPFPLDMIDSLC